MEEFREKEQLECLGESLRSWQPSSSALVAVPATDAAAGHDHQEVFQGLLDDRDNDVDRHGVIDALYEALKLEHPPH